MNNPRLSISAVERETGLSKDVLRVWERRYGFPSPLRDAGGERRYPTEQVERLRSIKRLIDLGHRPGLLLRLAPPELGQLTQRKSAAPRPLAPWLAALLDQLRHAEPSDFHTALQARLETQGLRAFVLDTVAALVMEIGMAWERGQLQVFEEHRATEVLTRVLRQAIDALPAGNGGPRVLLTTPPDEQHGLGLLMVEAIFSLGGAQCIALGTQTPLLDINRAARQYQADVVALSMSAAYPPRTAYTQLQQLRAMLPPSTALWAGGHLAARRLAPLAGVTLLPELTDAAHAVQAWRLTHSTGDTA